MTSELNLSAHNLKVFFTNFSDLDGRLDPLYYFSVNNLHLANNTAHPVQKLSDVILMTRGRFGHRPRNDPRFYDGEYPFIQTGDVVRASEGNGKITYSQTLNELGLETSRLFNKSTVVITIAANIGDTAILDYPACFPDSLIGMQPKNDSITLEYINLYFKFIKNYLNDLAPQSAQKNINYQQLAPVPIVIPPLAIQKKAVETYEAALSEKAQKEQQAQTLLSGVDTYLLNELGIPTLGQEDNSISQRIFIRNYSDISGSRADPYFHKKIFIDFFDVLRNSKYPVYTLKKLSEKITSGITPLSGGDSYTDIESGILFIRSGNIDINGLLDFSEMIYIRPEIHNGIMKSSKVQKNDLMIAIVGATIGQVGIYLDEREANINQAIALVRLNEDFNPQFVKELIKSSIGQMCLNRLKRPVARANINLEEISSMPIIVPPSEIQDKIVYHIQSVRNRAAKLREEATQEFEQAKREVEAMILGRNEV